MNLKEYIRYKYATFKSVSGSNYKVKIPRKKADIDSFFIFSLHKCGSTLLNNIMRDICNSSDIPYIDINSSTFAYGVPFDQVTSDIENIIWHRGYAYLGFRSFFTFQPKFDFSKQKKILLVRNPKDAIVSLYFSVKYSHEVPKTGKLSEFIKKHRTQMYNIDINEYAIANITKIQDRYNRYLLLSNNNMKVYKYEDVIFEKLNWVKDMCLYLNLDLNMEELAEIVTKYDIIPDKENPNEHIRQVYPGNHRKYLSNQTIQKLDEYLYDINNKYGYT